MTDTRIDQTVKRLDPISVPWQFLSEASALDEVTKIRWVPTEEELDSALENHRAWIHSNGVVGQQANLSKAELPDADLSGVCLSDADFSKAYLWDADLSETVLLKASFSEAVLTKADLSEADLRGADLSGAYFPDADLSEARLDDANLKTANGLQARQLRGSSVSLATLPEVVKEFAGLSTAKTSTRSAKKLFISVLVACAYAALAITIKTAEPGAASSSAANGSQTITLPIIGLPMPTGVFYLVTPSLLALLFGYFHLQMQRLWEELAQLPAIFPDGKPLDQKIHPWLITGLVRGHTKLLKEKPFPPFFRLQYGVAFLLAWWTIPVTLAYFAWMYPPDPGASGSLFLHILTALTAAGAIVAYRKATRTLELREHRPVTFRRPDSSEDEKWVFKTVGSWSGVAFLVVAVAVWYLRVYGLTLPW